MKRIFDKIFTNKPQLNVTPPSQQYVALIRFSVTPGLVKSGKRFSKKIYFRAQMEIIPL